MDGPKDECARIVAGLVTRYCAQLSHRVAPAAIGQFAVQLAALVSERGLPVPLADDEMGAPGAMSEEEVAPLVARVMSGLDDPVLRDAARQLVKACFYPEFKVCRDSFREMSRDGRCRRQELERVRSRISGAHCVDCPHFVALAPAEHESYLRGEWRGDPAVFDQQRSVFLPEDFRQFRRWLHAAARSQGSL